MSQDPVGNTGEGILLRNGGFDTQQVGGQHGRSGGIAADAQNQIGTEGADNSSGLQETPGEFQHGADRIRQPLALDTGHIDQSQVITQTGEDPFFDTPFRTDEQDPVIPVSLDYLFGNGDTREEMPSRSSAGDDDLHLRVTSRLLRRNVQ